MAREIIKKGKHGTISVAQVGDVGTVVAMKIPEGSGLGLLLIERTDPYNKKLKVRHFSELRGDWRPIRGIYEAAKGQKVKILESEGSSWGCHGVEILDGNETLESCKL